MTLRDNIASYVQNTCQDSETAGLKYIAGIFKTIDLLLMEVQKGPAAALSSKSNKTKHYDMYLHQHSFVSYPFSLKYLNHRYLPVNKHVPIFNS